MSDAGASMRPLLLVVSWISLSTGAMCLKAVSAEPPVSLPSEPPLTSRGLPPFRNGHLTMAKGADTAPDKGEGRIPSTKNDAALAPSIEPVLPSFGMGETLPSDSTGEQLLPTPKGQGSKLRLLATANPALTIQPEASTSADSSAAPKSGTPSPSDHRDVPLPPVIPDGTGIRALRLVDPGLLNDRRNRANGIRRWYDVPLLNDPLMRAARYHVVTPAESLLDGLGGMPTPPGAAGRIPSGARFFRIGPVTLRGAINLGVDYRKESGTSASAGNPAMVRDSSHFNGATGTANPGGRFGALGGVNFDFTIGEPATGHFMSGAYGLAFSTSPSNGQEETSPITQSLSLAGRLDFAKLKLGMGVSFDSLSGQNRDVGGEVDRTLLGLSLNASYPIGAKTTLDWDISVPIKEVSGGVGTTAITSTNVLNYAYSRKTSLGLGYTFSAQQNKRANDFRPKAESSSGGNDRAITEEDPLTQTDSPSLATIPSDSSESEQRPDKTISERKKQRSTKTNADTRQGSQTSNRIFFRTSFQATPKLLMDGDIGAEFTQFEAGSTVSPVIDWNARWTPREKTAVTLTLSESLQSSAQEIGESFVSSSITLNVSQQLGSRLIVSVILGYEHATYESMGEVQEGGRVDDLFTGQIALNLALSARWSVSASFSYSDNRSSEQDHSFQSTQAQIQTNFAF